MAPSAKVFEPNEALKAQREVRQTRRPPGLGPLYRLCPKCRGTNYDPTDSKKKCPRCNGKGEVLE